MTSDTQLPQLLAETRRQLCLRPVDVAAELGICRTALHRMETGERGVKGNMLARWLAVLGLDEMFALTVLSREVVMARAERAQWHWRQMVAVGREAPRVPLQRHVGVPRTVASS